MRQAELRATIAVLKYRVTANQHGMHHRGAIVVSTEMARAIIAELEAIFTLGDPASPPMGKDGPP